jgi:hypothetical protein
MRTTASARAARMTLAVLATALGLLVAATAAHADPGTVTGNRLSLTVSDTTPSPGETITVSMTYDGSGGLMQFGRSAGSDQTNASNLDLLALVPGSCAGQFSPSCTFTPDNTSIAAFSAAALAGNPVTGSAQFTVSASAPDGAVIAFNGNHRINATSGDGFTSRIALTVAAPPAADLGVGLSATAPPLSSSIAYDLAVTNNGPAGGATGTITTQLPTQTTSVTSSTCTYNSANDRVTCPVAFWGSGTTMHNAFTANFGLLSLGALNATATRTASAPTDPNPANDTATANCTAVTSLIITC